MRLRKWQWFPLGLFRAERKWEVDYLTPPSYSALAEYTQVCPTPS